MRRIPVESTSLKSIGYLENELRLEVEFTGGKVYDYFGLPLNIHTALMNAESKGAFFNDIVKAQYRFEQR